MNDKFTCPRRAEDGTDDSNSPFKYSGPNRDVWQERADKMLHCSYCGSVSSKEFIEYLMAGGELGVTDKNYKAYLGDAGRGKFYYQHLSEDQRKEFVELLNSRRIKFGYPGHFTALPYFIIKVQ